MQAAETSVMGCSISVPVAPSTVQGDRTADLVQEGHEVPDVATKDSAVSFIQAELTKPPEAYIVAKVGNPSSIMAQPEATTTTKFRARRLSKENRGFAVAANSASLASTTLKKR